MKLSPREKKIIAVGIVVVIAVAAYYASTLLPSNADLSRTVELKKKMLLKQRETLAREEIYKARLEQYKKQLEEDMKFLLPGNSANVAGAELQKILTDLAAQNSVEITQKNILPPRKAEEGLQKISVRIDMTCNPEQLVHYLAAIENYEKFLTVDELIVTGIRMQKRYDIRPSLTVSGYLASK